jgi:hypothetical protein
LSITASNCFIRYSSKWINSYNLITFKTICKGYIDRESQTGATRLVFHKLNSNPYSIGVSPPYIHKASAMILVQFVSDLVGACYAPPLKDYAILYKDCI